MPGARVEKSPNQNKQTYDISAWCDASISKLNSKDKKRFGKRKAAIIAYFTTAESLEGIARRYGFPVPLLQRWVDKSLLLHEDGQPWGFRALVPGATVVDHTPSSSTEDNTPAVSDESAVAGTDTVEREETAIESEPEQDGREENVVESRPELNEDIAEMVAVLPDEDSAVAEEAIQSNTDTHEAIEFSDDAALVATITPVAPTPVLPETPIPPIFEVEDEEGLSSSVTEEEEPTLEDEITTVLELAGPLLEDETGVVEEQSGEDEKDGEIPAVATEVPDVGVGALKGVDTPVAPTNGKYHHTGAHVAVASITRPLPLTYLHDTGSIKGAGSTGYPAAKKMAYRMVRKRWVREDRTQHKRKRLITIVSLVAVAILLIGVGLPLGTGLAAYSAYNNIRSIAYDGIDHLMAVKDLFATAKSDPIGALNADKLKEAQGNFSSAEADFLQLQSLLNEPDVQSAVAQFAPQYSSRLGMAEHLLQVAVDASQMGNELSNVGIIGANIIHSSPLASGSTKPLITSSDIATIEGSLVHAQYYLDDIQTQMSQVSLKELPISASQQEQLVSLMAEMPKIQSYITEAQGLIPAVSWLLGVGQARHFLVQTMDNAELRPGGGFTGQYGVLTIQDGRMGSLSLTDVAELDYNENGTAMGHLPPPGYSWMNFGNWGVRDSNLSADVPTDSRMVMADFEAEGGGPVDGDITFTPTFIGHIIDVTGPIHVPEYNEVITSKNLADRLHYYQQNYSAISREQQISGNYSHTGRKAFTSLLGKLLLEKVRGLPTSKLLLVLKNAVKDIQSRDLNIYFTNPIAENWLLAHDYGGALPSLKSQDGFSVVQANISISKASQYVHTTEQDSVKLDNQGGATHNLTITLDYQQKGPVYGFDTYADYIRVYAPPGAQLISADGFDTGKPLCQPSAPPPPSGGKGGTGGTGGTGNPPPPTGCGQYNTTSPDSNARYCPGGDYALGTHGYFQGEKSSAWPIDILGAPTATTSDLPGYTMWGGLTETPKNCISYITLSWYVPHVVHMTPGQSPYSIMVGKQGGMIPTVQISVDDSAIHGLKPFSYQKDIIADTLIALPKLPVKKK